MSDSASAAANPAKPEFPDRPGHAFAATLPALSMSALGIVFGDIGTSPLYTLKTVLDVTGTPDAEAALGSLSLIVWTLILITSVKYVAAAMRVDNDGEGGILALMSLLGVKRQHRPAIVAFGLFGAALIYGDGAITPAISVLSAFEGLDIATPALTHYVLPVSVLVLVALFAVQPQGTARIGRAFGPVMLLWFVVIGVLGVMGIARHPGVVVALDPLRGLAYLAHGGGKSLLVLGGVFLCVTGAEALYADMGHFGKRPIRLAWYAVVLPTLLLNYAGQSAIVLEGAPTADNIFYRLCPPSLLVPMVILSVVATIIASQSIITGAFSMTRQAIQLGWLPRMQIRQTSETGYGQIYVGPVNWLLMLATLGLTVGFGKSDNLAAAYGIAVSGTMLFTSALLFIAMREVWLWSLPAAAALAGLFILVDGGFFIANMEKFLDGGYVPLALAACVYAVMLIWHSGARAMGERLHEATVPVDAFMARVERDHVPRVPGTAVFLTRTRADVPPVLVWHLKQNRALHQKLVALTVITEAKPWIAESERVRYDRLADHFWRITARFGFMERPDIPGLLAHAHGLGCKVDLHDMTYYVGHETVIAREDGPHLPRWVEMTFALMQRNSAHVSEYFKLPRDNVVELGREVAI